MIESVDFEGLVWLNQFNWLKISQKGQRNRTFPKKGQQNRTFSKKGKRNRRFSKNANIYIELIYWFDWIIWVTLLTWVDSYVLSNVIELIGIFNLYRFMVTESIRFYILLHFHIIDLAWVVYRSGDWWRLYPHRFS